MPRPCRSLPLTGGPKLGLRSSAGSLGRSPHPPTYCYPYRSFKIGPDTISAAILSGLSISGPPIPAPPLTGGQKLGSSRHRPRASDEDPHDPRNPYTPLPGEQNWAEAKDAKARSFEQGRRAVAPFVSRGRLAELGNDGQRSG